MKTMKKIKWGIILLNLIYISTILFLIVFAVGWGKECYQRGVNDGYKLRKFETDLKGQQRLDSVINLAIKPKPYKSL